LQGRKIVNRCALELSFFESLTTNCFLSGIVSSIPRESDSGVAAFAATQGGSAGDRLVAFARNCVDVMLTIGLCAEPPSEESIRYNPQHELFQHQFEPDKAGYNMTEISEVSTMAWLTIDSSRYLSTSSALL
jgi:hypothetical protein